MPMTFCVDRQEAIEAILEFLQIYRQRPIVNNAGRMAFNHLLPRGLC